MPQSRSRVIERSCRPSPSSSHFSAIEVREDGPVGLGLDPGAELVAQQALAQVEVAGLADLEVGGAGDGRARLDEVGGVELLGAVLALVAAGARVAAVGAGALDVAVGQEAAVGGGVDLPLGHLGDEAVVGEAAGEMLGEAVVLRARGAAVVVEGEAEARRRAPSGSPRAGRSSRRPARRPRRRRARPGCRARRWRRSAAPRGRGRAGSGRRRRTGAGCRRGCRGA